MNGVEQRLKYLEETKTKIRNSINKTGGNLTEDTPFDEYYEQIDDIIKEQVISQDVVNSLMSQALNINGEEV